MGLKLLELKEDFLKKQKDLENARHILKTEFIGIDKIIDEVIDNVSSWYNLSDIQEKPLVINLWGLTGVGKTSLIIRLAELLNFKDRFFRFDLGEKEGRYSFRGSLEDLCENNDSSPVIIALDEFQHSRTVEGPFRKERSTDQNRMIWELIDSGKVQYINWKRGLWSFDDYIKTLHHLLNAGVKVEKGLVVSGNELYCKEMNIDTDENEELLFVSESEYDRILDFAGEQLNIHLQQDVRKLLLSYSGFDTIHFLHKVLKFGKRPSEKSFTKSLIFILGNIDEAYTMSSNFSADMDADEFHKQSLKITVPKIKKALQKRFRDEQIARLGNIHIIYPALNRSAYLKIIQNELIKYSNSIFQLTGLNIVFDESVINIVYKEGVYPTQGVRPIFTSVHYLLKSKLSLFLSEILIKDLCPSVLKFSVHNKNLICTYLSGSTFIHKKQTELKTPLEDIRRNKHDDTQAITAVHESGHAILSAILLQTIPEVIYSVTSDADNHGFIYSKLAWDYVSRKELIPRVAMMLGGYVAEELVFGKEYLTTGASGDIEKATGFLSKMYKESGMGNLPINYNIPESKDNNSYHNYKSLEEEIKQTIVEALELAEKTLKNEKQLLLTMSNYLSDNRMLKRPAIEKLINEHISNRINFITNGDLLYYRNCLKKAVECPDIKQSNIEHNVYSLNKEE
jgi:cell division protease FtsH